MRWVIVRCYMRGAHRPQFTTDDVQVVVKEMQRYADSKSNGMRRYPIGELEYRVLGDRILFYHHNRYGVRQEFACLKLINDNEGA
jgi:hypothetical protein